MQLLNTPNNFSAGKTRLFRDRWNQITNDRWILQTITGYKVELDSVPEQISIPKPIAFSDSDQCKINSEIQRFLDTEVIEEVLSDDKDEYISNIFYRPKKDGRIRIILNLKSFNKNHMDKVHFKMESLKSAISAMRENCYFGSVDLSEAFYSIPIRNQDRKYFRFIHNGKKYQFTALIMGFTASPRIFTKVLKPVFAKLRAQGHISTAYIDDSCLQGNSYNSCLVNIHDTVTLMDSLGLTVHPKKSVFEPCKSIIFLGFILCSISMTVRPTPEKCQKIVELCQQVLNCKRVTIRVFAQLIGKLVALEQGVEYAPLYYKPLEKVKDHHLKIHCGNFNSFMTVPKDIFPIINWWIENVSSSKKKISHGPPQIVLYSDASTKAWGAFNETEGIRTGGEWSASEQEHHINILELKACQLTLQSFCKHITNKHVRVYMDNTVSCAYVTKFGGKCSELDHIAREIWFWSIERNIHLSTAHVPGISNCEADEESRTINVDTEWTLKSDIFAEIIQVYPEITVDLFASRLNNQVPKYVSRRPDPNAFAIDAFTFTWSDDMYFIFPPFSLLGRILQKVEEDKAEVVLVAPIWPTQSWWPSLLQLISGQSFRLPNVQKSLYLPQDPDRQYQLKKMNLAVFRISGEACEKREFLGKPETLFCSHGGHLQKPNIMVTSPNGSHSAKLNKLTPFSPALIQS